MTRPQGDHLAFGPVEEAPNLLFQDLEMVQPFFQPVQSELSQEVIDLQQILDFTSSEVMDQQFNNFKQPTGRARNSSICSNGQPTGTYIYILQALYQSYFGVYCYGALYTWPYSQTFKAIQTADVAWIFWIDKSY